MPPWSHEDTRAANSHTLIQARIPRIPPTNPPTTEHAHKRRDRCICSVLTCDEPLLKMFTVRIHVQANLPWDCTLLAIRWTRSYNSSESQRHQGVLRPGLAPCSGQKTSGSILRRAESEPLMPNLEHMMSRLMASCVSLRVEEASSCVMRGRARLMALLKASPASREAIMVLTCVTLPSKPAEKFAAFSKFLPYLASLSFLFSL